MFFLKFKTKLFLFICAIGVLASITLAYLNGVVKPILWRECEASTKTMLTQMVSETLAEDAASKYFEDSMNFTYNSNGYVSTYSLNMLSANKIRAFLVKEIITKVKADNSLKVRVSVGTLSGISFFYGKGPKLDVNMSALYGITCDLTSEFSDSGINQTLHRLRLEFTASTSVKEPLRSDSIFLKTTVPISETVIVGDIPEAYTLILRADEDDENMINDYGARLG